MFDHVGGHTRNTGCSSHSAQTDTSSRWTHSFQRYGSRGDRSQSGIDERVTRSLGRPVGDAGHLRVALARRARELRLDLARQLDRRERATHEDLLDAGDAGLEGLVEGREVAARSNTPISTTHSIGTRCETMNRAENEPSSIRPRISSQYWQLKQRRRASKRAAAHCARAG